MSSVTGTIKSLGFARIFLVCILCVNGVWGASYTWTGAVSPDWNTSGNWMPVGVPAGTGADVTIPAGLTQYPSISSAPAAVFNLTIEADAQLTLAAADSLAVTGTLVNKGNILYESSGRITDGSVFINDAANSGTVTYKTNVAGTITGGSYANLIVMPDGAWITDGNIDAYNLQVDGSSGTATFSYTVTVTNKLTVGSGSSAVFETNSNFKEIHINSAAKAVYFNNGASASITTIQSDFAMTGERISFGTSSADKTSITGSCEVSSAVVDVAGQLSATDFIFNTAVSLVADTTLIATDTSDPMVTFFESVSGGTHTLACGSISQTTDVMFEKSLTDVAMLSVHGSLMISGTASVSNTITITNMLQNTGALECAEMRFLGSVSSISGSGTITTTIFSFLPSSTGDLSITGNTIYVSGNIAVSNGRINATAGTIELTSNLTVTGNNKFAKVKIASDTVVEFDGQNTFTALEINNANVKFSKNNEFTSFICSSTSSKTLTFAGGTTQTVTAKFEVQGASKTVPLALVSDTQGSEWNIQFNGSQSDLVLKYLSVTDSKNVSSNVFVAVGSSNGGGNTKWLFALTWRTDASSTDWGTASNWDGAMVPGTGVTTHVDVVIPGGASFYPAVGSTSYDVNTLTIESGASVKLADTDLTMQDSLVNSGTITYSGSGRIKKNSAPVNDIAHSGTVRYETGTNSIEVFEYWNLEITSGVWTASDDITVKNNLSVSNTAVATFQKKLIVAGSIAASNASTMMFNADVSAQSITAGGVSITGGTITTAGQQSYNGAVTLEHNASFVADAAIRFDGTINGAYYLTVNAGSSTVTFKNTTGNSTPLSAVSVTAHGGVTLDTPLFMTSGTQTFAATRGVRYVYGYEGGAAAQSQWGAGSGTIVLDNTDLFLDHNNALHIKSDLSCKAFYFYHGELDIQNRTITTSADFVVWGNGYTAADTKWSSSNKRWAYYFENEPPYKSYRGGSYSGHVLTLIEPKASFAASTGLQGANIRVHGNFYNNGANMNCGAFTMTLPNSDASNPVLNKTDIVTEKQWGKPYAVAFNMTVAGSTVAAGYVAAAQNVSDGTNNTRWQFLSPEIVEAYTVSDNVVYIRFSIPLENSHGEIGQAISNAVLSKNAGGVWYNSGGLQFTGVSKDKDGTALPNDDTAELYVHTTNGTWNTDATGSSDGAVQSTDKNGTHCTVLPNITMLEGVFMAADGKTMCVNYNAQTVADAYTAVSDRCAPVLTAVYTGQELHELPDGSDPSRQKDYDAHNFIEFRYSEAVEIAGIAADAVNIRATDELGAITTSGSTIHVAGLASMQGSIRACNRTTKALDPTVHALYRKFAVAPENAPENQTHRIRVSIAGYVDGTVIFDGGEYKKWLGYIDAAATPSGVVTRAGNQHIKDVNGNVISASVTSPLIINNMLPSGSHLYGAWDISPPTFAPIRIPSVAWSKAGTVLEREIIGGGPIGVVNAEWIEIHVFDNTPDYDGSDSYTWFTKIGWCSGDVTSNVVASTPDKSGGARAFATDASKTCGGIRQSSLVDAHTAFSYTIDGSTQKYLFASVMGGAESFVFKTTLTDIIADEDSLYFKLQLADPSVPLSEQFTITFDADSCCITDLAGNRMNVSTIAKSIDLSPPELAMTIAPLALPSDAVYKKLLIIFSKKLSDDIHSQLENVPTWFEIKPLKDHTPTDIAIAATPAAVAFSNEKATGLILELTRAVTLDDIRNMCIAVKEGIGPSIDPVFGVTNPHVSFIKDSFGNSLPWHTAHALSDFAVNAVQPLYAYDKRVDENKMSLIDISANFTIRDWNKEQQNNGTLFTDSDITIVSKLFDGTNTNSALFSPRIYLSHNPSSDSVSVHSNSFTDFEWRVWLPTIFKILAENENKNIDYKNDGAETNNAVVFTIPKDAGNWQSGEQVSFMFELLNNSVIHNPIYDGTFYKGTSSPLYALRLKSNSDITSLDLWSFRLKEQVTQRGGVSIFNNVIDANAGESVTIKIHVQKEGRISVMVMTLDGDIVQYLERGTVPAGEHFYAWNGTTKSGKKVARGMYFVRIVGAGIDEARKVMVVKE